jgi:alkanesulfonate monooxygenase SsuD/methylene tetrahydromethanopterin reductase-like flavin-dependent oxidoreductase (luciferase family)
VDEAYFRVHHFARQLASPFPLLSAIGAKTNKIEIGTGVIDMRYENPMYMVEDASAADPISSGRLQLGISRGSPEQVVEGWRYFGYKPGEGETDADMGRQKALELLFTNQPANRSIHHLHFYHHSPCLSVRGYLKIRSN